MAEKAGRHTLKITIHEDETTVEIKLEGRVAGPWVAELSRTWLDVSRGLRAQTISLDLRDVTYCDAKGKQLLHEIYRSSNPQLVTSTPWTQYLAQEITQS